jgi:alpha-1,4-galacturonosyltransferase
LKLVFWLHCFYFIFILFSSFCHDVSLCSHRELKAYRPLQDNNLQEVYASSAAAVHYDPDLKDVNIVATYSDHYGNIRLGRVKMGDLSPSWVLENPAYQVSRKTKGSQVPNISCSGF